MSDYLIITGLSGAGRSTAAATFEDLGDRTTRVFHREALDPPTPVKWLIEPLLRDWLAHDTPAEMVRLKQLLEDGGP